MDEDIELHVARPEDAGTVGGMLRTFNDEFETPGPSAEDFTARFRRLLAMDSVRVFLSGNRQRPTGFLLLTLRPSAYFDGPLGQVEELYVVPGMRGRGHGSALLRAAIREVQSRHGEELHVPVDEVDADARRFYARHGFTHVEREQDGRQFLYTRAIPPLPVP